MGAYNKETEILSTMAKTVDEFDRDKYIKALVDSGEFTFNEDGSITNPKGKRLPTRMVDGFEYIVLFFKDEKRQTTYSATRLKGYHKFGDIVFEPNVRLFYDYRDDNHYRLDNLMINVKQ